MTNCKLYIEGKVCRFKWALKENVIKDLNGQAGFLKEVLLQVICVETGNVSTDVRYENIYIYICKKKKKKKQC